MDFISWFSVICMHTGIWLEAWVHWRGYDDMLPGYRRLSLSFISIVKSTFKNHWIMLLFQLHFGLVVKALWKSTNATIITLENMMKAQVSIIQQSHVPCVYQDGWKISSAQNVYAECSPIFAREVVKRKLKESLRNCPNLSLHPLKINNVHLF